MRVVFAGPSIYGLEFDRTGLTLHPPAACGDVLKAVLNGAKAVGLIDGVFANEPSVWHKEILHILSRSVPVLGAASMGALRAAECDSFGMVGIGHIYADYRDGVRTADSDVALLHAPAEMAFRPLTVALVDVEATLEAALAKRALLPVQADNLARRARELHFTKRTWSALAAAANIDPGVLQSCQVERKRQDALALIEAMHRLDLREPQSAPAWTLNRTKYLALLERRVR
ncbi:MAG: TfuA-like protein [Micropepsaceae bacterium]